MARVLSSADASHPRSASRPAEERFRLATPLTLGATTITDVVIAPTVRAARVIDTRGRTVLPMAPVPSPLLLSGLSPRAAQLLRPELDGLGAAPIETATGASSDAHPQLIPGSAIGVQLMRGDVNAVAVGTLTHRDGNMLVGFGHPFLNRGRTAFLLTPAVIHEVVRSAVFPFKLGSAGAPVGTITEDRRAGIGGRVGALPPMVAIRVVVHDRDRNRVGVIGTKVVRDQQLGPLFALSAALDAIDRAMDRVGEGTARVRLTLRGRGLDSPLVRENVYYHARDIGTASLVELPEALRLLFANEFVRTGPIDVHVEVEVEGTRQTATITEAVAERSNVRRGEVAKVRITVRPYQGPVSTHTVEVAVPPTFPAGSATLVIRAGSRPTPELGLAALLSADANEPPAASATSQLSTFTERDRNTDLVVELVPGAARFPGASESATQTAKTKAATPWVVRGRVQVPITIDAQ
jgi:cell division septation protein DedD